MQQRHGHGSPSGRPGRDRPGQEGETEPLLKPPAKRLQYFQGTDPRGRPIPRPELLDEEAQFVAKQFASIPASQLRRFYAAVTSLRHQLDLDKAYPDESIKARLALLKAHAAYAQKRISNMPDEFVKFFVRHADAVQSRTDFLHGFAPHFEAVIAYHKMFEKTRQQRT